MLRKLAGYLPLTFFSFILFTLLFHHAASAHTGFFDPGPTPTPTSSPLVLAANDTDTFSSPQIPDSTPTPTNEPTSTPTLTPTPKVTDTPTETPTPIPETPTATPTPTSPPPTVTPQVLSASTDLETLFSTNADTYHVSKDELKKIADCESHFNTQATNGDYTGMYQFATSSWQSVRQQMGQDPNPDLRRDASESIKTAAYMLSQGRESAWPSCK